VIADLVFYAFALLTVLSGFFVVFSRNIVHAAFSLLFTLFGVAGLFAMLSADFLAATQIIVYIGGVLVLVLFTVMMTRIPRGTAPRRGLDLYVPAGILALAVFGLLYRVITSTRWPVGEAPADAGITAQLGAKFMTDYIFPFEYASLLILMAMIGAAILVRERRPAHQVGQFADVPDPLAPADLPAHHPHPAAEGTEQDGDGPHGTAVDPAAEPPRSDQKQEPPAAGQEETQP
jgi:NADH-quinone oxidoreductase subunit J